jgi:prepilin-type N-terminal cleavage/methylation domain-containing protein
MRGEARNEQGGIDFKAFTLIEVIVSITIFSIIMISIIAIYILSSDTSAKSDINRAMHENLKSVITEI